MPKVIQGQAGSGAQPRLVLKTGLQKHLHSLVFLDSLQPGAEALLGTTPEQAACPGAVGMQDPASPPRDAALTWAVH